MKATPLKPLFFVAAIIILTGLACSAVSGSVATQTPEEAHPVITQAPLPSPTKEPPLPTKVLPTPVPPTDVPATDQPSAQDFFTEEFDGNTDMNNWTYFTTGKGTDDNLKIDIADGYLVVDLGDEDLYTYLLYTPYIYSDVALLMNAENRGRNNNNISLVCRYDDASLTWYEFSVESGGLWYLYAYDKGYNILDNGGTNALKQGKEVNEYGMICDGNQISLFINGTKIKTVRDNTYDFQEGLVGFNISSLNVLPITVNINYFDISQP